MKLCIFALIYSVAVISSEITEKWIDVIHENPKCRPIMKEHGLSGRFPGAVAHGVHSITLEDIRYYFKASATENNKVPTLNYDLKDPKILLPNAPLYGFDTSFRTVGLRYADQVLRNMDKKDFYLTYYNTLEQIIHTLHMGEVWERTKHHYDQLVSRAWNDRKVCTCVTDVNKNGIMKMLPFMALKIRYPGVTSGKVLNIRKGYVDWSNNLYTYNFVKNWSKELKEFDFNQDTETILKEASGKLVDGDDGIKHLNNEASWTTWKRGMKHMVDHDDYELAMFLYCALKY